MKTVAKNSSAQVLALLRFCQVSGPFSTVTSKIYRGNVLNRGNVLSRAMFNPCSILAVKIKC